MTATAPTRLMASNTPASRTIGLRTVVVATDLSPGSSRALRRVAALPYRPRALIVLVHVLDAAVDKTTATLIAGGAEIALEKAAGRLAGWLADRHRRDVRIQVRLLSGERPWHEIDRLARGLGADLVCVGKRGQSRLRQLVPGTTARRLVRRGAVPVLLVNRAPRGPYKQAVLGVDLTNTSKTAARLARRLVPLTGRLTAIHAFESPLRNVPDPIRPDTDGTSRQAVQSDIKARTRRIRRLVEPLAAGGRPWAVRVEEGDARGVLYQAALDSKADLVAVGSAGRTGVNRVLLGSVAESMLERAPCDVLVVRVGTSASL
jgi:nucleotide-binding universal stress UspA family protein